MSSTITALTSGGGLAMAGDTSGQLELKTNNGTTAVTVTTAQFVGIGETNPNTILHANGDIRSTNAVTNSSKLSFGQYGSSGTSYSYIQGDARNTGYLSFYTNVTEQMKIDASGRVTMPNQPKFWAGTTSGGTVNSSTVLPFDYTDINVGSNYNTGTKRFTAPIAGTYYFIAQPALLNPADARITIRKNGTALMFYEQAGVSGWQTCAFGMLVNLAVNDYVDVYNAGGASINLDYAGNYSNFSGWLVG